MIIEVYVTSHAHDKDIDKFIYALMEGLFYSYQSMYFDYDTDLNGEPCPNVRVEVKEREELDAFGVALRIYQGLSALFGETDIEVNVNDAFVASSSATFEPALAD